MTLYRLLSLLGLLALLNCAAYSYSIAHDELPEPSALASPLFVEPISENAELELRSASQTSGNVTTTNYWKDKPFFAQPHVRRKVYKQLLKIAAKQKLVGSRELVNGAPEGRVRVVRTTLVEHRVIDSNAFWQTLACTFGAALLCPPLWAYNILVPVRQDEKLHVIVKIFELDAADLDKRLVSQNGSTDPVFDARGLKAVRSDDYETLAVGENGILTGWGDGLFMNQEQREQRLVEPMAEYLKLIILESTRRSTAGGLGVSGSSPAAEPEKKEDADPSVHAY